MAFLYSLLTDGTDYAVKILIMKPAAIYQETFKRISAFALIEACNRSKEFIIISPFPRDTQCFCSRRVVTHRSGG